MSKAATTTRGSNRSRTKYNHNRSVASPHSASSSHYSSDEDNPDDAEEHDDKHRRHSRKGNNNGKDQESDEAEDEEEENSDEDDEEEDTVDCFEGYDPKKHVITPIGVSYPSSVVIPMTTSGAVLTPVQPLPPPPVPSPAATAHPNHTHHHIHLSSEQSSSASSSSSHSPVSAASHAVPIQIHHTNTKQSRRKSNNKHQHQQQRKRRSSSPTIDDVQSHMDRMNRYSLRKNIDILNKFEILLLIVFGAFLIYWYWEATPPLYIILLLIWEVIIVIRPTVHGWYVLFLHLLINIGALAVHVWRWVVERDVFVPVGKVVFLSLLVLFCVIRIVITATSMTSASFCCSCQSRIPPYRTFDATDHSFEFV